MSCSGCRVLRKGCSEDCMLRQCLQWIDNAQAQANATVFVAKFFGRAGLMSFISSVPEKQRPALFQSLLFEAVGRVVNPVSGAVGLLWTGNWNVCQTAVMTVLRGGTVEPLFDLEGKSSGPEVLECASIKPSREDLFVSNATILKMKRKRFNNHDDIANKCDATNLDLRLNYSAEKQRAATPSEESETTTLVSSSRNDPSSRGDERKVLQLFV